MANRYWVGGTASWDGTAGTKWSATSGGAGGASVPTSADDVFLDANSTGTVTIATGNTGAKSLNCTGFTGTLTGSAAISIAGSITLVSGMTFSATGQWNMTGTGTLITAGKDFTTFWVDGVGITATLGDAYYASVRSITVNRGTFNTAGFSVTVPSIASNSGLTRTISFGASTVTVQTFINWTGGNFTFNAGTSSIVMTSSASAIFSGAGLTFYNVTFSNLSKSTSTARIINDANTFNNLTINNNTSGQGPVFWRFSANQTINGTLTVAAGTDATYRTFLASNTIGTQRTLTCAAVSLTDVDFRDIRIAGGAAGSSGTRLGDCKGNTGITFTAAKTVYWNLAGTQNWTATGWATSSGGSPAANNFPLAQDTAVFDDAGSAGTVSLSGGYANLGNIDFSARTTAMTFDFGSSVNVSAYGNITNSANVTWGAGGFLITFAGRGSQTITSAGQTFRPIPTIDSPGGTLTLQDALTVGDNGGVTVTSGTLALNGYTISALSLLSMPNATAAINFGSGTFIFRNSGNTFTRGGGTLTGPGTISGTSNTAKTIDFGASITGSNVSNITVNQGGAGALTISQTGGGLSLTDLTNTYAATGATTVILPIAPTTFTNFTASGALGNLLTLQSSSAGSRAPLSKTSGTVSVSYCSIKDTNATGGATWQAFTTNGNVDAGNNLGWIFSAGGGGNFLMLFKGV